MTLDTGAILTRVASELILSKLNEHGGGGMGWPEFLASVISSVAWPSVVVALLIVFRRPLLSLVRRISAFDGFGARIEFENGLDQAEVKLAATPEVAPEGDGLQFQVDRPYDLRPRHSVVDAWRLVESALRHLAERKQLENVFPRSTITRVVDELLRKEIIGPQLADSITQLRHLRNVAVHSDDDGLISYDQAMRFADNSARVAAALNRIQ